MALGLAELNRIFPLPRYSPIVLTADGSVLHAFLNPNKK
jgi:penicillin-binding protein 1C